MDIKTFDVLAAAKGRSYPTDSVIVYTDVAALYAYNALNALANDTSDSDTVDTLDTSIAPLREAMQASALKFHMRGFAPGVRDSINNEARAKFGETANLDDGEPFIWRTMKYIVESIIRVENAEGALDEHRWSLEDVEQLQAYLPDDEFAKIISLVYALSFSAWQFDAAITADFS